MRDANARAERARRDRRSKTDEEAAALGMNRRQYLMYLEGLAKKEGVCRKGYTPKW